VRKVYRQYCGMPIIALQDAAADAAARVHAAVHQREVGSASRGALRDSRPQNTTDRCSTEPSNGVPAGARSTTGKRQRRGARDVCGGEGTWLQGTGANASAAGQAAGMSCYGRLLKLRQGSPETDFAMLRAVSPRCAMTLRLGAAASARASPHRFFNGSAHRSRPPATMPGHKRAGALTGFRAVGCMHERALAPPPCASFRNLRLPCVEQLSIAAGECCAHARRGQRPLQHAGGPPARSLLESTCKRWPWRDHQPPARPPSRLRAYCVCSAPRRSRRSGASPPAAGAQRRRMRLQRQPRLVAWSSCRLWAMLCDQCRCAQPAAAEVLVTSGVQAARGPHWGHLGTAMRMPCVRHLQRCM